MMFKPALLSIFSAVALGCISSASSINAQNASEIIAGCFTALSNGDEEKVMEAVDLLSQIQIENPQDRTNALLCLNEGTEERWRYDAQTGLFLSPNQISDAHKKVRQRVCELRQAISASNATIASGKEASMERKTETLRGV